MGKMTIEVLNGVLSALTAKTTTDVLERELDKIVTNLDLFEDRIFNTISAKAYITHIHFGPELCALPMRTVYAVMTNTVTVEMKNASPVVKAIDDLYQKTRQQMESN